MKFHILFVIAVVLLEQALASSTKPDKKPLPVCLKAHESYHECNNRCPQLSCENYKDPPICTLECSTQYAGCYCDYPYVRDKNGECVLEKECEDDTTLVCLNAHETYHACNTPCAQVTCDNYKDPLSCIQICSEQYAGCYCDPPYIRGRNGNCVLEEECEVPTNVCINAHETYRECSNGCETTCDNYNNPPICTQECSPQKAGCYCDYPYVRNTNDGGCVLQTECPAQVCTKAHEKYRSCSNNCPQLSCDNYDNPPACTKECSTQFAGCYCESPYVRNEIGDCVLTSQCKPKVVEPQPWFCIGRRPYCKGRNEAYVEEGTLCPKTCATKDVMFKCKSGSQRGCFCRKGYLRNSNNICVKESKCS